MMTQKWKCTVCGYLHEGADPPEFCPVCGADRAKFIPLEQEKVNLLHDMVKTFVLHPVAAHFPNGLIPTAVLFLLLTLLSGNIFTEHVVIYLLGVVLAVIPVSIASGVYDWRTRFHGERAMIFYKKIGLAATLLLLVLSAVRLRYADPGLLAGGGARKWAYVGFVLTMLAVVTLLGHYGTKLAHHWKKKEL
jgi:rubredoxin/uncharacterized membrane protein